MADEEPSASPPKPPKAEQLLRQQRMRPSEGSLDGALIQLQALPKRAQHPQPDSVSQCSIFGAPRPGQAGSQGAHFEIRWRNLSLFSRRSRLPALVLDSRLHRWWAGRARPNQPPAADDMVCYSPPVQHKALAPAAPPPPPGVAAEAGDYSGREFRSVISNLNGSFVSGQLTAILGPSGVGKTSLLRSLTGRNSLEGTGSVRLLNKSSEKRMSVVTVPQNDILPDKLTAMEDLQFTSRLKNPAGAFDHDKNIARVVALLQLAKFLHTRIGRLSGGEQRRLSIARELLGPVDILILDEPTSGLDANTCKKIILALRDIVEQSESCLGRPIAIIITIHQPQQEVLMLFHRVYVMAIGGRAIFEGPPARMMATLLESSSLGHAYQPEQLNENPAIVALEVASGEFGPEVIEELAAQHQTAAMCDEFDFGDLAETGSIYAGHQSPFMTPRSLRGGPRKSPLAGAHLKRQQVVESPRAEPRLAHTPKLGPKFAGVAHLGAGLASHANLDKVSVVTSVSYASTWDAELPADNSRLKVDKRLRRSVVLRGDFRSQTLVLMRRNWLLCRRDLFLMSIRILGFLLVALGIVQIVGNALVADENLCPYYETEVADVQSFIEGAKLRVATAFEALRQASSTHLFFFFLILSVTMVVSALTGLVFPLQMRMFLREYNNGWYSPASFVTSNTLAELPFDVVGPLITMLISYPLTQQPASAYCWREALYTLVVVLAALICKSQAQIVGAFLMNSVENSVFMACVLVSPPALLSGIAVKIGSMSPSLQLVSYSSFLRYAFESLMVLRYGYAICPCDPELVHGYPAGPSADAIPQRLIRMADGFIELANVGQANHTGSAPPTISKPNSNSTSFNGNILVEIIRLMMDSSNLHVDNLSQLGDCDSYRSLYLMDLGIDDHILPQWLSIMLLIFLYSRLLTYLAVRAVIKLNN